MLKIKTNAPLASRHVAAAGALGVAAAAAAAGLIPAPDLSLAAEAAPAVQVHLASALAALAIGTVLMLGPKGRTLHRGLGWTWVAMMAVTAISSLFIRELNHGAFSFIHFFSGWTLVGLPMGVAFARRHKVRLHRRTMTGLYLGGLVVAGAFTFVPGRLMWRTFFG